MVYAATPPHGEKWPRPRNRDGRVAHLQLVEDTYPDWGAVYKDNVDRLYRIMYARVGNRADAEDLTADVFKAALVPLRLGCSKGEVRAYLLTTARTVLASHWRRTLGHPVTFIDPEQDLETIPPEPQNAATETPERVRRILDALPERYRRILELRFLQANTIKEAAGIMDVTVGNAKVLQHRALVAASKVATEIEL